MSGMLRMVGIPNILGIPRIPKILGIIEVLNLNNPQGGVTVAITNTVIYQIDHISSKYPTR